MAPIKLFVGYDQREHNGWQVFMSSLIEHSGASAEVRALAGKQLDGTNWFTYERFRIPELSNWSGMAIFMDACDMLLQAPLKELASLYDSRYAVQVVKHDYKTKHPRKYIGTNMEADNADYPRKNWSSVVIWNCGHPAHFANRNKIKSSVASGNGPFLHRFAWLKDEEIGELPIEWNWLVDEYGVNDSAKMLHWTTGMPGFPHYTDAPMAGNWHAVKNSLDRFNRGTDLGLDDSLL